MGLGERVEGNLMQASSVVVQGYRLKCQSRVLAGRGSRGRTMSYQPGICMPKFYPSQRLRTYSLLLKLTTVTGMFGAFGKMNLHSGKRLRNRQFSTIGVLTTVN